MLEFSLSGEWVCKQQQCIIKGWNLADVRQVLSLGLETDSTGPDPEIRSVCKAALAPILETELLVSAEGLGPVVPILLLSSHEREDKAAYSSLIKPLQLSMHSPRPIGVRTHGDGGIQASEGEVGPELMPRHTFPYVATPSEPHIPPGGVEVEPPRPPHPSWAMCGLRTASFQMRPFAGLHPPFLLIPDSFIMGCT